MLSVSVYWEKKNWTKQRNDMVYNIVPLQARNAHVQHQILHDTHTLKSSFETYKNALKNMYIDIFICIQIGPSQQKQTHITIHVSEFCHGSFSTEMRRLRWRERASERLFSPRRGQISQGGKLFSSPNTSTEEKNNNERQKSTEPQLKCFFPPLKVKRHRRK